VQRDPRHDREHGEPKEAAEHAIFLQRN
jgi:hypothetical protein